MVFYLLKSYYSWLWVLCQLDRVRKFWLTFRKIGLLPLSNHWQSRTCQIYIFIYSLYKKAFDKKKGQIHFCQNDLFKSLSANGYFLTLPMSGTMSLSLSVCPEVPFRLYIKASLTALSDLWQNVPVSCVSMPRLPPFPHRNGCPGEACLWQTYLKAGGGRAWLNSPLAKRTSMSLSRGAVRPLYRSLPLCQKTGRAACQWVIVFQKSLSQGLFSSVP